LYPYPAKFVYGFVRRRQREINELRQLIEDETPLTIEESRTIRSEVVALESRYRKELDSANDEISRLKAAVKPSSIDKPSEGQLASIDMKRVTKSQVDLLKIIEKFQGCLPESQLVSLNKKSKVKTEFDLGELEKAGLLEKSYSQEEEEIVYSFTHDGRRALLEASVPLEESAQGNASEAPRST